jgi:cell volume regulation protein A
MEQFGPYTMIIASSVIILISFFFVAIAKKTNVPSVLLLIGLGVGLQYLLAYLHIDTHNFFSVLEVLGILGLIMIVLEAALDLKLRRDKIGIILKSLLIAVIGLGASLAAAGAILFYMLPGLTWAQALLYGTPLSILSSAIIIPSVGNLKEEKREFHIYESTFSDIIGIMLFYFLISYFDNETAAAAGLPTSNPFSEFGINLAITIAIALVVSYVLLIVFQNIKTNAKLFVLISLLMLLYAIAKTFHLSPLIIILVFGLAVSNSGLFFRGKLKRLLHAEKFKEMEHGLHSLTAETAFIVRTFFFVIFGLSILISSLYSLEVLKISSAIFASIFVIRWIFLRIFIGKDISPQVWIAPRGLITVLLFYAIPPEFQTELFDSGILLFIIIATGIFMTIGLILNSIKSISPEKDDEEGISLQGTEFTVSIDPKSSRLRRWIILLRANVLLPLQNHTFIVNTKKKSAELFHRATKALGVKSSVTKDGKNFGKRVMSVIRNPTGVKLGENKDYIALKKYVYKVIFENKTLEGVLFDVLVFLLIILSVAVVMIQSVGGIPPFWAGLLFTFDLIITILFTAEYVLRLWTTKQPKKYALSTFGIIDLLAILPLFLEILFVSLSSLGIIRILRLLRIFRVLKLARFLVEADVLAKGLKASANKIFVFLFFVLIVCTVMGSVMYVIEGPENGFNSIPKGVYWAVVTMTTVGYGDISPGTPIGQFIAMVIMILGYGVIAVPTGLAAAGVASAMKEKNANGFGCPKCKTKDNSDDSNYCRVCGTDLTLVKLEMEKLKKEKPVKEEEEKQTDISSTS